LAACRTAEEVNDAMIEMGVDMSLRGHEGEEGGIKIKNRKPRQTRKKEAEDEAGGAGRTKGTKKPEDADEAERRRKRGDFANMTPAEFATFAPGELPQVGSDGYSGHEERDEAGKMNFGPPRGVADFQAYRIAEEELRQLPEDWSEQPRIVRLHPARRRIKRKPKWVAPSLDDLEPHYYTDACNQPNIRRIYFSDDMEAFCTVCRHFIPNATNAYVNRHIWWHQQVHKGRGPRQMGTKEPVADSATRWKWFLMYTVEEGHALKSTQNSTTLPKMMGLRGFKMWGRTKIMNTYNEWAERVFERRRDESSQTTC
jgi:hypothetical protein